MIRLNGDQGIVMAGKDFSEAAFGVPFITFCAGGPKADAECHPVGVKTEEEAIAGFFREANAYADECQRMGKAFLVWRVMPHTDFGGGHKNGDLDVIWGRPFEDDLEDYWVIYGRLAIIADPRTAAAA